ncbi:MAG: SpoIID/LytB domain-containing protein [Clostridia bacterium]|nr:SpoIID/LytB domain-containing protein [Clostridia bacterium]
MKTLYLILIAVLVLSMILIPLAASGHMREPDKASKKVTEKEPENLQKKSGDIFTVYDTESKKSQKLTAKEYICGVVAAEMPASFQP